MDLLNRCRDIILNNINNDNINDKTLDILSYAILAVILTKEEIAIKKLPIILRELDIYMENSKVINIAHEKLNNDTDFQNIADSDACITRTLVFDKNNQFIAEKKTLIISIENKNTFNLIVNTVHELIHTLRFNDVIQNNDNYKIKNGICITYYNSTTESLKQKHYYLEEGIVQYYTNIAISTLNKYLIANKIDTSIASDFTKKIEKYDFNDYLFQTTLIKKLCIDETFASLLDETFTDISNPPKVISYYNDIFNSPYAFTDLSKEVDIISKSIQNDEVTTQFNKIKNLVSKFTIITRNKKN